jgi:DNA-binding winged helix-turn-helix (wHTH) protein
MKVINYRYNYKNGEIICEENKIKLTYNENEVFRILSKNIGYFVDKKEIARQAF